MEKSDTRINIVNSYTPLQTPRCCFNGVCASPSHHNKLKRNISTGQLININNPNTISKSGQGMKFSLKNHRKISLLTEVKRQQNNIKKKLRPEKDNNCKIKTDKNNQKLRHAIASSGKTGTQRKVILSPKNKQKNPIPADNWKRHSVYTQFPTVSQNLEINQIKQPIYFHFQHNHQKKSENLVAPTGMMSPPSRQLKNLFCNDSNSNFPAFSKPFQKTQLLDKCQSLLKKQQFPLYQNNSKISKVKFFQKNSSHQTVSYQSLQPGSTEISPTFSFCSHKNGYKAKDMRTISPTMDEDKKNDINVMFQNQQSNQTKSDTKRMGSPSAKIPPHNNQSIQRLRSLNTMNTVKSYLDSQDSRGHNNFSKKRVKYDQSEIIIDFFHTNPFQFNKSSNEEEQSKRSGEMMNNISFF